MEKNASDAVRLRIYVDGSGPGPSSNVGGWATVHIVEEQVVRETCGHVDGADSVQMEMQAALEAVRQVQPSENAVVYSDYKSLPSIVQQYQNASGYRHRRTSYHEIGKSLAEGIAERPGCSVVFQTWKTQTPWTRKAHNLANKARKEGATKERARRRQESQRTKPGRPDPAAEPQSTDTPAAEAPTTAQAATAARLKKRTSTTARKPKAKRKARRRKIPKNPQYETPSGMHARGWTPRLITMFLGEADELRPNPRYSSAAPMRCYRTARVKKTEERKDAAEALKNILERRCMRSKAARRAAETRRENERMQ